MVEYVKLIGKKIYYPPKNKDGVCNYNLDVEHLIKDGYKPLIRAEKEIDVAYNISYIESDDNIIEVAEVVESKEEDKKEEFEREFFNTSLGYVRRKVNMQNGDVKDFLCDIVPRLQAGVKIITYNIDGTQNKNVLVTQDFIAECDNQFYEDFYGKGE